MTNHSSIKERQECQQCIVNSSCHSLGNI